MHEIEIKSQQQVSKFTEEQIGLIKRQICKDATDDELKIFLYQCNRTGLDPFARQIYAVKRWDGKENRMVMGVQTAIDGFRLIAERTGKYLGQDGPYWCDRDGVWKEVWLRSDQLPNPSVAKVGVIKTGCDRPIWGIANWESFVQLHKDGKPMWAWQKMPELMLAKCAEAQALRKAFPNELSGLYTPEEIRADDGVATEIQRIESKPEWKITAIHADLLRAAMAEANCPRESVLNYLKSKWNLERIQDLKEEQFDALHSAIKNKDYELMCVK